MFSCPFQLMFQVEAKERAFISICQGSGTEPGSLFPLSTLTLVMIPWGEGEISQNLHFYRSRERSRGLFLVRGMTSYPCV